MRKSWPLTISQGRGQFGKEVGQGGGTGAPPARLWERKLESCLSKPGIILAGIPGPADELSHGRGQSREWTGDPELVRSEKKRQRDGLLLKTRMGVLVQWQQEG